jgi:hypothetical protein
MVDTLRQSALQAGSSSPLQPEHRHDGGGLVEHGAANPLLAAGHGRELLLPSKSTFRATAPDLDIATWNAQ